MPKTSPRLEQLVSVRGLAAWLVVVFHSIALLRVALPDLHPWIFDIIAHGYLAVDFFFMLSGFIIFINYYDKFATDFRKNSVAFYWNRFTRIYPVHLLVLLAYVVLAGSFIYFSSSKSLPLTYSLSSFLENIFLVQAWSGTSTSWNVPSWSISAEWFVYLLFPIFAVLLRKNVRGLTSHFVLASVALATAFGLSQIQLRVEGVPRITDLPLVRAFFEFLLGTIVGSLYIHHNVWLKRYRAVCAGSIVVTGLAIIYLHLSAAIAVPLMCLLLVCSLSVDTSLVTRWLSTQPLIYLGEISYSTYMVHYLVYDLYKATWLQSLKTVDPASLFASFAIVLGLSMIMHKMIEIPAQRYLRSGRFKRVALATSR